MRDVVRSEEGVTSIEYTLIAILIALVIIVGATAVGVNVGALFNSLSGNFK